MLTFMTKRIRQLGPPAALLIFIAAFTSSCGKPLHLLRPDVRSPESVPTTSTPAPDTGAPQLSKTPQSSSETNVQSEEVPQTPWLLQPGLLSISKGIWLNLGAFLVGALGMVIAINSSYKANRLGKLLVMYNLSKHDRALSHATTQINSLTLNTETLNGKVSEIQRSLQQIEQTQARLVSKANQFQNQPTPLNKHSEPSFTYAEQFKSTPPQPELPSPADLLAGLTAAVNRSDRQTIRNETRAQLNITSVSENDIVMGRTTQTELEEVTAGGSYLLATIDGVDWLYPTEQTLKSFSQSQPSKGIFGYIRQAVPFPQVVTPARLAQSGSGWQIEELGSIAIPG